ncbi:thiamine-phosphate kinase [Pseudoduganella sp. LjRoot289]|uniref:thiamine-phosphate kinase n=1 Tax=Pseudoduganella sp. LjRoot289 TaxID=3342314 RepID=UPI003ED0889D
MPSMKSMGEKEFLRGLLPSLRVDKNFVNGFGHDASIVDIGLEKNIAFKIDRAARPVLRGRNPDWFKVWGRLAVVSNLSDLLAVGAEPKSFMVSIIVPGDYDAADIADIVAGCQGACEEHGVSFVGGDTKEGADAQVVGSAFGVVGRGLELGRGRAKPGDKLVIAGQVGGFMGAYALLRASDDVCHSGVNERLWRYVSHPLPQIGTARAMSTMQVAAAACDLSDGLADAIDIFCGDSVGITIQGAALPLHPLAAEAGRALGMDAVKLAFGVGDWALAYVLPSEKVAQFLAQRPPDLAIAIVGEFTAGTERVIAAPNGTTVPAPTVINEHFRDRLEDEASRYAEAFAIGVGSSSAG